MKLNNQNSKKSELSNFPFSSSCTINSQIVFAGYGIDAHNDTLEWNDYKYIDVKNKVVLVFRFIPKTSDFPDELFENDGTDYRKTINAIDNGAIGIILIDAPNKEYQLKSCRFSRNKMYASIPAIRLNNSVVQQI